MKNRAKFFKRFFYTMIIISVIIILGSVGSLELNQINLFDFVKRVFICVTISSLSIFCLLLYPPQTH